MANVVQITLRGIDQMSRQFRAPLSSLQQLGNAARRVALPLAGMATAAGAALAKITSDSIAAAVETRNLAEIVGFDSVEAFSRLQFVAQSLDVGISDLRVGINTLNKSISAAAEDAEGKQAQAFERLGISIRDTEGNLRSNREVFLEVAERFAQMEDGALKSALALSILGESGARLLPVLNLGRDGIEDLGRQTVGVSEEFAEAAARFDTNMRLLRQAFANVAVLLGAEFAPALAAASDELLDLRGSADRARPAVQAIREVVGNVVAVLAKAIVAIRAWARAYATAWENMALSTRVAIDFIVDTLEDLGAELKQLGLLAFQLANRDFAGAWKVINSDFFERLNTGMERLKTRTETTAKELAREVGDSFSKMADETVQEFVRVEQAVLAFQTGISGRSQGAPAPQTGGAPAFGGSGADTGRATDEEQRLLSIKEQQFQTILDLQALKDEAHARDIARLAELQQFHQQFADIVITAHQGWLTLLGNTAVNVVNGLGQTVAQIAVGARDAGEAFKALGQQMVASVVAFMVQRVAAMALEKVLASVAASLLTAQAAVVGSIAAIYSGIWATPAALAMIATAGSAASALSVMPAILAGQKALAISSTQIPTFAAGSEFIDSTGPAIVHRGERIVQSDINADLTKFLRQSRTSNQPVHIHVEVDGRELINIISEASQDGRLQISERAIS